MKRILSLLLALIIAAPVHADTCGKSLTGVFTAFQAVKLCKVFGSAIPQSLIPSADNTYDVGSSSLGWRSGYFDTSVLTPLIIAPAGLVMRADADAQRLLTWDASSDTALVLGFGDGSTTAAQELTISALSADADDDGTAYLTGGGAAGVTRGAFFRSNGNEVASTGGNAYIVSGNASGADVIIRSNDTITFESNNGTERASFNTATGGGLNFTATGFTLGVDSGTAASACKGTGTFTGTTAVTVATTCAATGMVVNLQRTSAPSGTAQCWFDTVVNGTSFNVDCDGAETGTFAWWITKEG